MSNKIGRNDPCPCGSGKKYKNCALNTPDDSMSELFQLTQHTYNMELKPYYEEKIGNPKTLIQFSLLLPFYLPIEERGCTTLSLTGSTISISYTSKAIDESYKVLSLGDSPRASNVEDIYTKLLTVVELTYVTDEDFSTVGDNAEGHLNKAFDEMILNLNAVIEGYQAKSKDKSVHYLTKEMFNVAEVARIVNIETWETLGQLFTLHPYMPYNQDVLPRDEIPELLRLARLSVNGENPFIYGIKQTLAARRYYSTGFYQESVIYAQISVESFIRTLFKELLITEGKTDIEIQTKLEDTSFMNMIKKELPQRIGGNWNVTSTGDVAKWHEHTYKVRNRVVHTGYIPTFTEADNAVFHAVEFKTWVIKQLRKKKKQYPRLNEYFTNQFK